MFKPYIEFSVFDVKAMRVEDINIMSFLCDVIAGGSFGRMRWIYIAWS